jgi:hypothetical protein
MNGWSAPERRCRDALFAAMIPGHGALPPLAALDLAPFWDELDRAAPLLLRLGLRGIVWALTLLPIFVIGAPRTFLALDPDARARFLARASVSPVYLVRQMVLTLKTLACMAYLRDPAPRLVVDRGP